MSLVNQMLQDLDKRKADPDSIGVMPEGVRMMPAAPVVAAHRRWLPWLVLLLLALVAFGLYGWRTASSPSASPAAVLPSVEPVEAAAPLLPATEATVQTAAPAQTAKAALPDGGETPVSASKAARQTAPRVHATVSEQAPAKKEKTANSALDREKGGISVVPEESEAQLAERLFLSARQSHAQGRLSVSQGQLSQALAIHPAHRGARSLWVQQLLESGETGLAAELLAEGLQLLPVELSWLKALARLRLESGHLAEARALLERLPELARDADVRALAGAIAYRQQDYPAAANHYRAALAQRPNVGRDWVALALVLEAQAHHPEARESFRRALLTGNLDPRLQALAESRLQP